MHMKCLFLAIHYSSAAFSYSYDLCNSYSHVIHFSRAGQRLNREHLLFPNLYDTCVTYPN